MLFLIKTLDLTAGQCGHRPLLSSLRGAERRSNPVVFILYFMDIMLNYVLNNNFFIQSKRLVLSCFKETECDDMYAIQSNPAMVMYTPDETWKSKDDWDNFWSFASCFYGENKNRPEWFRWLMHGSPIHHPQ